VPIAPRLRAPLGCWSSTTTTIGILAEEAGFDRCLTKLVTRQMLLELPAPLAPLEPEGSSERASERD